MNNYSAALATFVNNNREIIVIFSLAALVLKGFSLWRAAKQSQKYWFIVLLTFNTLGILELLYLKFFSKSALKLKAPKLLNKLKKSSKK